MFRKIISISAESIPVLIMIGLIPFVQNDYTLAFAYALIIGIALSIKRRRHDFTVFIFGFMVMILSEYLFVSTGVEVFFRNSLFGIMPLWLPFLWGYGFVAIKRGVRILES